MKIYANFVQTPDDFHTLTEFIGTPVWVKTNYIGNPDDSWYLKIVEPISDNLVDAYLIQARFLDDLDSFVWFTDYGLPSKEMLSYESVDLTKWEIPKPMLILSDEEIQELLAQADDRFKQDYLAENGVEFTEDDTEGDDEDYDEDLF